MTITLQAIEARIDEVSGMLEQFKAQQLTKAVQLPGVTIELRAGEHYAGAVLTEAGDVSHHLVLLPGVATDVSWASGRKWAEAQGGELPTRQEQSLLFANCKAHLQPRAHWSSEAHEDDASYAWSCYFINGYQDYYPQSAELAAVAVRRIR